MLIRQSEYVVVAAASAKFATAMVPLTNYRFVSTVDCYINIGATGGAAAASDGSHLVGAGQEVIIQSNDVTNGFCHTIRIGSSDGVATLSLIE
jgi:hypothetical protein